MAGAMPERLGVAGAGRRVRGSRHDKARSPERHNPALCLIAGPEHLEGEVSRHVSRPRHRERQINITASCAWRGKQSRRPASQRCEPHVRNREKRRVGWSLMPAAERRCVPHRPRFVRVGSVLSCAGLRLRNVPCRSVAADGRCFCDGSLQAGCNSVAVCRRLVFRGAVRSTRQSLFWLFDGASRTGNEAEVLADGH